MYAEKLLKLADFLDTVPSAKFQIRSWVTNLPTQEESPEGEGHCGFAGCAIGWAAHAKLFPGLSIHRVADTNLESITVRYDKPGEDFCVTSWGVPRALFDLTGEQSHWLFGFTPENNTPKKVAAKIRDFVKVEGK